LFAGGRRRLRTLSIEERRGELRRLIPRSPKSRLQFSDGTRARALRSFTSAERLGLEGIVSKRLGSHYRSGRVDSWRKVKCWTESALILIGTELLGPLKRRIECPRPADCHVVAGLVAAPGVVA
jgi:ATP-dependent DNA ligase